MKVLIQNTKTGQYLAHQGHWTASAPHAKDFHSSQYAYSLLRAERISGLRVLFYYEKLDYCVRAKKCSAAYFDKSALAATFL